MRKDYSPVGVLAGPEPDPAQFWTRIWEETEIGENLDVIRRQIESSQEYPVIAPYLQQVKNAGGRVLDGGCGLGGWVVYLQSQGFDVLGVDFSAETIERLNDLFPKCNWQYGDITALDCADGSFAGYISWGTFEHFEIGASPPLREAYRVLRDDGLLMISVPYDNVRVALQNVGGPDASVTTQEKLGFYQWRFNRRELARELSRHGFEPLEIAPIYAIEGARRLVTSLGGRHLPDMPRELLARGLRWLLPKAYLSHMLLAVARKCPAK